MKLSTRPEKRVGADALWDQAESRHVATCWSRSPEQSGGKIKTGVNPGEGAFYGPKFEYVLRDAIGRDWQCGTIQVDFNLPERFGAFYIDADGEKKTPVMIHRAIFGSMERFAGILLENTAGHLPLWLAPVQAKVCTIVSDADAYAEEVLAALQQAGLRAADRPAQREDQLQGARALAGQDAGHAGGRQARGRGAHRLAAPPGQPGAAGDAARRADGAAGGGGRAAGPETGLGKFTPVSLEVVARRRDLMTKPLAPGDVVRLVDLSGMGGARLPRRSISLPLTWRAAGNSLNVASVRRWSLHSLTID